jgi:biotin synthase
MKNLQTLLYSDTFDTDDLVSLLNLEGDDQKLLFLRAAEVKEKSVGNKVYLRGLIEFSNLCSKDCLYCGIRKSNLYVDRYNLGDNEILEAVRFAHENNYASIVLQSGELASKAFTRRIENLLRKIHAHTRSELRVTLSLGEQSEKTYRCWFEGGAHRYLLRIETSDYKLYGRIHPRDKNHRFENRLHALELLKKTGYQTGTGVMIGLPFQTTTDLANDLLFMRDFGIDMVGMGPYLEHAHTPLSKYRHQLLPLTDRFNLSLRMIAILRILMPGINIAAATALQAIDKMGREKGIRAGANVIMPNITPEKYRDSYKLYENKPCIDEKADNCTTCLEARIGMTGNIIGYGEWGDSMHYQEKHLEFLT